MHEAYAVLNPGGCLILAEVGDHELPKFVLPKTTIPKNVYDTKTSKNHDFGAISTFPRIMCQILISDQNESA